MLPTTEAAVPARGEEKVQMGVRVDAELYRRYKVLAAERGATVAELVERAMREALPKLRREGR